MKCFLSVFFTLFTLLSGYGQNVKIEFADSTVAVNPGTTFKNSLIIINLTNEPISVKKNNLGEKKIGALLDVPAEINLNANEKKAFPLKFMGNDALIRNGNVVEYQFTIQGQQGTYLEKASFLLDITDDKNIWIVKGQEVIYLDAENKEQEFSFVIENGSYQPRNVELDIISNPSGLELTGYERGIELKSKERKWIKFRIAQNRRNKAFSPDYQIEIRIKDQLTGEEVASSRLIASALSNSQQLFSSQLAYSQNNSVELTYNQTGRNYQYTQLKGAADFSLGKSLVSFSTILEYYNVQNGFNIYDTWVDIQREHLGVRVGNLSGENIDFNLSGRGGKLSYAINDNSRIEVVGVENNYQLYSTIYRPFDAGKTVAASYFINNNIFEKGRFSMLYSKDPGLEVTTKMASFESAFVLDSVNNLRVQGGLSHESWDELKDPEIGFAFGVVYDSDFLGWKLFSDNFYSTPNYSGNRRGNFSLNERLSRELNERQSIFITYLNSINKPRYFGNQTPFDKNADYNTNSYDDQMRYIGNPFGNWEFSNQEQSLTLGFTTRIRGFTYSIESKVEDQRRKSITSLNMFSYRLGFNISTDLNSHSLSMNTNFSLSQNKNKNEWFKSFKGNLGYHWKGLGINAMYQVNPYYVSDLDRLINGEKYWTVAIRPNYNFTIGKTGIKGRVSLSSDYVSTYAMWMKYAEAHFDYKIGKDWDLTGDLRMTRLNRQGDMLNGLDNTQFRLGIRKRFARRTAIDNHKVQISFYDDENDNRLLDADELLVNNLVVKLDEHVSMTDTKGKVKYLNVPKGDYRLTIASDEDWRVASDGGLIVDKNIKMDVPLIKVVSVQGKFVEKRNKYDRFETDVQGIKVYARNEAGIVISTLTDEEGTFRFNLALGNYTVYIQNNRYHFYNSSQQIVIGKHDNVDTLLFEFKKKNTDIKVQKF